MEPYCCGLKSESEMRKETKCGLLSLGAQLWREENVRARARSKEGSFERGEVVYICLQSRSQRGKGGGAGQRDPSLQPAISLLTCHAPKGLIPPLPGPVGAGVRLRESLQQG